MKKTDKEYAFTFMALRRKMKVLLGALAVLIGLAFVFGGLTRGCGDKAPPATDEAGTLFGTPVSHSELAQAKRHSYMASPYMLMMLEPEEREKELARSAWERLACLRYAEMLGIRTGPDELRETIKKSLSSYGAFNEAAYSNLVSQQFGSPQRFEQYFQQELVLEKLGDVLASASLVPPFELSKHISDYTDTYKAQYVLVLKDRHTKKVKVSQEEMEQYLQDNRDMFMEPKRMRVTYVAFPVSNYLDHAAVSEFDIEDYYDRHRDDKYLIEDTNSVIASNVPFDDVKDEIKAALQYEAAAETAYESALDFVFMLAPRRDRDGMSFAAAAAATNLTISTSSFFAVDEEVEEMDVSREFSSKAFELVKGDPEKYFSTPIEEANHVFVAAYHDSKEPHMPEFEAVSDRIREIVLEDKKDEDLDKRANEIRDSMSKSLADGKTFKAASKRFSLKPHETESFGWLTVPTNICDEMALWQGIISRQQGEITEPIATTNGVVLAYLVERTKSETGPDPEFVKKLVEELRANHTKGLYAILREHLSASQDVIGKIAVDDEIEDDVDTPSGDAPTASIP